MSHVQNTFEIKTKLLELSHEWNSTRIQNSKFMPDEDKSEITDDLNDIITQYSPNKS